MSLVGEFSLVSLPETLQWSMPLALLVSSVLVFSRMSADSEIAAMRACGVNLLSVMKWPVLFAFACTVLGFWVNNEIVPRGHQVRRSLKTRVSVQAGLSVLEPGRVIDDFPKIKLYFGSKEGNWVHDLVVLDYSNPKVDRMITAEKALIVQSGSDVDMELYQMTVDPVDDKCQTMARANRFVYTLKDAIRGTQYRRRMKDFGFFELLRDIRACAEKGRCSASGSEKSGGGKSEAARLEMSRRDMCERQVELSKRFVFALASVCFVLVGIPLGIRSQRKESSVGMAISLAVSLGYYLLVILMLSAAKYYRMHPEWLIFLPVAACLALAWRFTRKHL